MRLSSMDRLCQCSSIAKPPLNRILSQSTGEMTGYYHGGYYPTRILPENDTTGHRRLYLLEMIGKAMNGAQEPYIPAHEFLT